MTRFFLSLAAGLAMVAIPRGVRAADAPEVPAPEAPQSDVAFELSAKGGYATPPTVGAVTSFGAGIGGRIGLSISNAYVGATAIYYFGGSESGASQNAVLYGLEVGYGFRLSEQWMLRPFVGAGGVAISHTEPRQAAAGARPDVVSSASGRGGSSSSNTTTVNAIYVEPGLSLLCGFGSNFAGVSASLIDVPNVTYSDGSIATWVAYSFQGQLGHRF